MTPSDTATHFLQTLAAGGEVAGGWLYARALQQCRLDFTPESLDRLDQLLAQARAKARPSRADLDGVKGRNLTALLAFYLIEMVRRRTGAFLEWHDRESAVRVLPPGTHVPHEPFARLLVVGLDQGVAFWPLGWTEAQLLPDGRHTTALAYIDDLAQMIEREVPSMWCQAAEASGRLASWQMMWASRRDPVAPTMLASRMPATWQVLASGEPPYAGVEKTLADAGRLLEENREGHAWQLLSYDGFVEDAPGQRTDAILVIAYTYGAPPLRMKLAFPYRQPADGRPFTILQPRLREANVENQKIAWLQGALERGLQGVTWLDGASWNALRER